MALFNVTNQGYGNLPPTVVGDITINITYDDGEHIFTIADFTTGTTPVYSDPEGDDVETVKIVTLPTVGTLELSEVAVIAGDEITLADIVAGNLIYNTDGIVTAGYTDSTMTFNIADDGSSSYGAITPGIVTFVVGAEINLPPSAVGNKTLNLSYAQFYPITRANLTTETTPAYADPEGDAEENVKILSLPSVGTLLVSGLPATVNQIIPFTILDSGFFVYLCDAADLDGYTTTFDFAISDVGSGEYTS